MRLTPQTQKTQISYSTAALRDIPMDVPMTAATADDDDNRCCNRSSIDDDNSTIDHTFFQEWEEFYKDFQHSINSTSAPSARIKETHSDIVPAGSIAVAASNNPAAAEPEHITFTKELDALHTN